MDRRHLSNEIVLAERPRRECYALALAEMKEALTSARTAGNLGLIVAIEELIAVLMFEFADGAIAASACHPVERRH